MELSDNQFNGDLIFSLISTQLAGKKIEGKKITINLFCSLAGISKSSIYEWRRGEREGPNPRTLEKIVKTFNSLGIYITSDDFYNSNTSEEYNSYDISETQTPYETKNEIDINTELLYKLTQASKLLEEKNSIINKQFQTILDLRKEIDLLKSSK